jgi:enoyl-CoA hydratase/carnithine racemase
MTDFDAETVRLDLTDDVATLTVDRPDSLNAVNLETLEAIDEAVGVAAREDARCLVLTGAGEEAFVAGADVSLMRGLDTPEAHDYCRFGQRVGRRIEEFPAPTIAAINGYAFGGGMEFALCCDLRVASERAVLGQTELDLGIIPGWGGTQRLPRLVGDEVARRLIFFAERVDAQDALELGIVGEVVAHDELDERVEEQAAELAAKPRFALEAAKEALNVRHETGAEAGLAFEARAWSGLFGTRDQREGMEAFVEKRDPEFE